MPLMYARAAASVSFVLITGSFENDSTDSLYGMMLNASPSSSPATTCSAASRTCWIFSPFMLPDLSMTIVTSRLIFFDAFNASFGGTPAISRKYPPPNFGSGYASSDALTPSSEKRHDSRNDPGSRTASGGTRTAAECAPLGCTLIEWLGE